MEIGDKKWVYVVQVPEYPMLHIVGKPCFDSQEEAEKYRDTYNSGAKITYEEHAFGGDLRVEALRIN